MSVFLEMTIKSVEDEIELLTAYGIKMSTKTEEECELDRLNKLIKAKKADLFFLEAMRDSNETIEYINHTENGMKTNKIQQKFEPGASVDGKYFVRVLPRRSKTDKIEITYHIQQKSAQFSLFQKIKFFFEKLFKN